MPLCLSMGLRPLTSLALDCSVPFFARRQQAPHGLPYREPICDQPSYLLVLLLISTQSIISVVFPQSGRKKEKNLCCSDARYFLCNTVRTGDVCPVSCCCPRLFFEPSPLPTVTPRSQRRCSSGHSPLSRGCPRCRLGSRSPPSQTKEENSKLSRCKPSKQLLKILRQINMCDVSLQNIQNCINL